VDAVQERSSGRYQSRPGRSALVAATLDELTGPKHGVVKLPCRLLWQPNREINLDDAWQRRWMYEVVLREAIRTDELRTWLNCSTLRQLWPDLHLPHGVHRAWEDRHPELRTLRIAA
jgi:hypothetical protein